MHLIIYIFKFLAQSIHMVLRYSHFVLLPMQSIQNPKRKVFKNRFEKSFEKFFRFLTLHLMLSILLHIFQFLDQSIHMVLRCSHYTVISGIITYTVI